MSLCKVNGMDQRCNLSVRAKDVPPGRVRTSFRAIMSPLVPICSDNFFGITHSWTWA